MLDAIILKILSLFKPKGDKLYASLSNSELVNLLRGYEHELLGDLRAGWVNLATNTRAKIQRVEKELAFRGVTNERPNP